ncbi:hypothetical protein [Steroidobacter agaridevorans]|uniref:hypothetical protein n=1 Tax=Steroidobacter agaridevorans TaxID=2695856 RepID=UPI001FCC1049|nr:hypothetical protein [Steroidobacter agaridevorans]
MGDPGRADPDLLPSLPSLHTRAEIYIAGHRVIACDYSAIHENLADAEHPFYLHRGAFENHRVTLVRHRMSGVMEVAPRQITFLSRCDEVPPTNFETLLLGLEKNQGIDIAMTSIFTVPGCFSVDVNCKSHSPSAGRPGQVNGCYLWCSTPSVANSCHFWWILSYDHAYQGHAQVAEIWNKAIQEDIDVLEAIQRSIDWSMDRVEGREMLVAADRPVAAIRRMLSKAVEAERTT